MRPWANGKSQCNQGRNAAAMRSVDSVMDSVMDSAMVRKWLSTENDAVSCDGCEMQ